MSFERTAPAAAPVAVIAAAALVLALATSARASWGLFIGPINSASGFGAAAVSLAVATGALAWGAALPVAGLLARRVGAPRLLAAGGVALAAVTALVPFASSGAQLILLLAASGIAGAAAGSAPVLVSLVAPRVAAARRGLAVGALSAGSSLGQLGAAPLIALAIAAFGWEAALFGLAVAVLAVVPLARALRGPARHAAVTRAADGPVVPLATALASRDYWLVSGGYFVCGFHVTFLATHMPGVIDLCGLPAGFSGLWLGIVAACGVASSLAAGHLMQRVPMKSLLAGIYALRALGVLAFVVLPKSETMLLAFALWMGLTSSATLPPTSGLVTQLFGARNVATLFGFTLFVHQIGSFLGAWLGGIELEATGGYTLMWSIDVALALAAALAYLPVREARSAAAAPALAVAASR